MHCDSAVGKGDPGRVESDVKISHSGISHLRNAAAPKCAYNLIVRITFDPNKNERNIRERDLPFQLAAQFEFGSAYVQIDSRRDYGETRYVALGELRSRIHILCFTQTAEGIRVISLRKANDREVELYAKIQNTD